MPQTRAWYGFRSCMVSMVTRSPKPPSSLARAVVRTRMPALRINCHYVAFMNQERRLQVVGNDDFSIRDRSRGLLACHFFDTMENAAFAVARGVADNRQIAFPDHCAAGKRMHGRHDCRGNGNLRVD